MSFHTWTVFALFRVVFVTPTGTDAVNRISNRLAHGFRQSLWRVLAVSFSLYGIAPGMTGGVHARP